MLPYVIRLPREFTVPGRSEHDGQEFMYVLGGRIEWEIGGETLQLEPGDAVYLDSRIPHRARALDGEALALVVVTPRASGGRAVEATSA
jgi:quercetin dioxygenase-like cupin family protein